jgi:hypothetical protein
MTKRSNAPVTDDLTLLAAAHICCLFSWVTQSEVGDSDRRIELVVDALEQRLEAR